MPKLQDAIFKWFKMQPDCTHLKEAHAHKLAEYLSQVTIDSETAAASPETAAQPPAQCCYGMVVAGNQHSEDCTEAAQPMSERELGKNVVDAALSLLDWVPTASRGSSGYSRQETLRIAIERWQAARAGMPDVNEILLAVEQYRHSIDHIYNDGEKGRELVVKYFGTTHPRINRATSLCPETGVKE